MQWQPVSMCTRDHTQPSTACSRLNRRFHSPITTPHKRRHQQQQRQHTSSLDVAPSTVSSGSSDDGSGSSRINAYPSAAPTGRAKPQVRWSPCGCLCVVVFVLPFLVRKAAAGQQPPTDTC